MALAAGVRPMCDGAAPRPSPCRRDDRPRAGACVGVLCVVRIAREEEARPAARGVVRRQ